MSNPNARWPLNPKYRSAQIFAALEATPDINRGEQRLAAEVALAQLRDQEVSGPAFSRAFHILETLATK
jgi:hypothetical protein